MPCFLIADDHPLVRAALVTAVEQAFPDAVTVEAGTFPEALAEAERQGEALDLALLDIQMPGVDGLGGLAALRARLPALPVVIVSASEDESTIQRALLLGAAGFVPKSASLEEIGTALHAVLEGRQWVPVPAGAPMEVATAMAQLTNQQRRVLALLAAGKLNKQIAYELGLTEATVKAHVTAIFRRLGVTTRTQAALAVSML